MNAFDDVALPGLEPEPGTWVPTPERSLVDHGAPPVYRRWRAGGRIHCADCITVRATINPRAPLSQASYLRITSDAETPLCFLHKQQRMHRDSLGSHG